MAMQWNTLFTTQRTGESSIKFPNPDQVRTSFLRDYDRIIFSSAFRRLQNKTQVFPLPGSVLVHNRLTHSLEVASVGRSLGKAVGGCIASKYPNEGAVFQEFYNYELASVIAAASLAHDIGNPPFGHSGEDAIRDYFSNLDEQTQSFINKHVSADDFKDFLFFEGNANALRVLTNSFKEEEAGGFKLTLTTLASIIKYPCRASEGFNKQTGLIATKKSGYFKSEEALFQQLVKTLEIPKVAGLDSVYARHPFVYLVEAADDICYRIIDIEDAHRLGIVSFETMASLFLPFFEKETGFNSVDYIHKKLSAIQDPNQKVQFIRAKWIGLMVEKLTIAFMEVEEELLEGTLEKPLLDIMPENYKLLLQEIERFSLHEIYRYKSVVEIEIAGFHIIGGLLHAFISALMQPQTMKSKNLLLLIPKQFVIDTHPSKTYDSIQSIVDYIAGMTDLYALDLYRKITGINVPELN
jgi:dGTPase